MGGASAVSSWDVDLGSLNTGGGGGAFGMGGHNPFGASSEQRRKRVNEAARSAAAEAAHHLEDLDHLLTHADHMHKDFGHHGTPQAMIR